jgi:hypothetical protein
MSAFLEAFFATIGQVFAERGLKRSPKSSKTAKGSNSASSKKIPLSHLCLMVLGMAAFSGTIALLVSLAFRLVRRLF